jgi:hypothetical protein
MISLAEHQFQRQRIKKSTEHLPPWNFKPKFGQKMLMVDTDAPDPQLLGDNGGKVFVERYSQAG